MLFVTLANGGSSSGGGAQSVAAGHQQTQQAAQRHNNDQGGEWNQEEIDRFSFDDSDRFEEDSLCSWSSEPESVCNNWRGWKRPIPNGSSNFGSSSNKKTSESEVCTLTELAAKCVASFIPFELVEHVYPPVPEQLQLRIAFWSFPDNEEDIRLYSCLANSSSDEFHRGEQLFRTKAVKDALQIGFHLSATVISQQPRTHFNVAVTFDRRRISSCNCTCSSSAYWCSHVVAVCLHRIHCPHEVCLRAPVSESLTRLQRDQLQKFAQYLISELPQQILPTAQRLLDELLSSQPTAINTVCGAPDPTAGASANDQTSWYLDEKTLHENIKQILIKFCLPAPIVFSDVNYLSNSAPPAAAEWSSLLRPLRGREPEGMWNLLSIVREMYQRCDRNAVRLLEIITEECMACDQILIWWFQTKLSLLMGPNSHSSGKHNNTHSNSNASQHACSSLCDEIVVLWRLAALNPGLAPDERDMLHAQFTTWHLKILDRVAKCRMQTSSYTSKHLQNSRSDAELFVGFKPAIESCYLDWEDYPISGVTHTHETNPIYYSPFTCFKHTDSKCDVSSQLNATQAVMANNKHYNYISTSNDHHSSHPLKNLYDRPYRGYMSSSNNSSNSSSDSVNVRVHHPVQHHSIGGVVVGGGVVGGAAADCNRSSASSEGFCENEDFGGDSSGNNMETEGGRTFEPTPAVENTPQTSQKLVSSITYPLSDTILQDRNSETSLRESGTTSGTSTSAVKSDSVYLSTSSSESNSNSFNFTINNCTKTNNSLLRSSCSLEETKSSSNLKTEDLMSTTNMATASNECKYLSKLNTSSSLVDCNNLIGVNNNSSNLSSKINKSSNSVIIDAASTNNLTLTSSQTSFSSVSSSGSSSSISLGIASSGNRSGGDKKIAIEPIPSTSKGCSQDIRRVSKDESFSSSSDEFVNSPIGAVGPTLPIISLNPVPGCSKLMQQYQPSAASIPKPIESGSKQQIFSNVRPSYDEWDILLARAEGLHAHGHGPDACILAVRLAEEMLENPPNLMIELPPVPKRKGKKQNINPISHQLSVLASSTLSKCAFLCTVLSENPEHYHIAFRICLFAIEMPRPPASTKPLEVKLANQEADLLALLKKIPLDQPELVVIRERAELLKSGSIKTRGDALLPINMASFIFDALVMPSVSGRDNRNKVMSMSYRIPTDENLGFEAAVAALGLKANVSEAEHPLLCEGTRRQRGDLALTLLSYYKDEPRKIAKIMEKLLDRDIHILLKTTLLAAYYSSNPPVRTASSQARREEQELNAHSSMSHDVFSSEYNSTGGNSRPHSSTSAELEVGINAMCVSSPVGLSCQTNPPLSVTSSVTGTVNRSKDIRSYKGKRAYPSIPNQPSEASAHFMFELSKNVLTKAGGTSSTSLFTQATTNQNHHGPHRALHMCAFQLGLYALGLHNCVSPNWLSRTYSSHVSWIIGQAMEIGAPAISFLIETWEGHLTPPEAAGMADRASRGWDSNMIYPAAELALSVLPHAAALNPNEIQRAILQCKEQSDQMLERACITVENAAKGGGVYPEVLFQIARYWYELYLRNTPNSEQEHDVNDVDHSVSLSALIESQEQAQAQSTTSQNQQVVVTTAPPPFQQGVTTLAPIGITPYPPYSFCQGIYHHHNITYPTNQMQMYITPQAYQYPPPQVTPQQSVPPPPYAPPGAFQSLSHPQVPTQAYQSLPCNTSGAGANYAGVQLPVQVNVPPPTQQQIQQNLQYYGQSIALASTQQTNQSNNMRSQASGHLGTVYPFVQPQTPRQRHPHQYTSTQLRYLLAAYNVGMLAMETLARRVHDDRPQAKYARNPPYGEDVKWLLRISKKLGTQYLHQFCVCAVNSIVSPFVLHDVAIESAHYLGRSNPTLVMQHLRSALTPLVQKCQQMYIQCIHQKLYHLTQADYEEFSSIILAARAAFQITPEGSAQFKDWLQSIKRSKSCKKDLWTQINTALQTNSK